ncbi:MAG: PD40 domain-containing protein [Phycisphaerae bacterium]|nr:PD40 domain-containing protein [Phycisphaerae bacterium]
MPAEIHKLWIALCATVLISVPGCVMKEWPAREEPIAAAPAGHIEESRGNRRVSLFGRGDYARDIVFEGKVVMDLQQHTACGEGADFDPDVGPTGEHLIFASTRHSPYSRLYMKSVGGTALTQITDEPANDAQPALSPAGNRIAFASDRGGHWDIWVVDANGRNAIQITNDDAAELHPSWSPDGKRLVYCRIDPRDNHSEMWLVGLGSPGVKRLIGEGLFPEWSPLGDKIAYQRPRDRGSHRFSIWTLDIKDDEVLRPTEVASSSDAALITPTWSPDGTQIAFTSVDSWPGGDGSSGTRQGGVGIGIVDADGCGLQRLTDGLGENYSPAWSVDGRIYFTAKLHGHETIWSVKPFRPAMIRESEVITGDRRAAAALEMDVEE